MRQRAGRDECGDVRGVPVRLRVQWRRACRVQYLGELLPSRVISSDSVHRVCKRHVRDSSVHCVCKHGVCDVSRKLVVQRRRGDAVRGEYELIGGQHAYRSVQVQCRVRWPTRGAVCYSMSCRLHLRRERHRRGIVCSWVVVRE